MALTKAPLREDTLWQPSGAAMEIRQELLDGADFAEVALRESSDEVSAANGGDLGTFGRGQMVPAFDSVVFNCPPEPGPGARPDHLWLPHRRGAQPSGGQCSGPAHPVPVERTNESEIRLLTLADSLEVLGESMTLDEAAGILGRSRRTNRSMTELFPFLAGAGQISDGLDWAFREAAPGEVSPVFEDQAGLLHDGVGLSQPRGFQPLENATAHHRTVPAVGEEGGDGQGRGRGVCGEGQGSRDAWRSWKGTTNSPSRRRAPSRDRVLPGLGYQSQAVGAAFGLELEEISDPVVTNSNVFLIQTLGEDPADSRPGKSRR